MARFPRDRLCCPSSQFTSATPADFRGHLRIGRLASYPKLFRQKCDRAEPRRAPSRESVGRPCGSSRSQSRHGCSEYIWRIYDNAPGLVDAIVAHEDEVRELLTAVAGFRSWVKANVPGNIAPPTILEGNTVFRFVAKGVPA